MSCCSSCYSPQRGSRGLQGAQGPVGDTGANAPEIFMTSGFTGGDTENPLDPIISGGSFDVFSWADAEIGQTILVNVNFSVNEIAADGGVIIAISWSANQVSIFPTAIVSTDNPISVALTKTIEVLNEDPLIVSISYSGSGGTSLSISNVSVSIIVTPAPP